MATGGLNAHKRCYWDERIVCRVAASAFVDATLQFWAAYEDTLLFTHLLMYDRETGIGEFSLEEPELLDFGLLESMEDASSCAFDCISANARLVHQHHQTH
jgi:hypothetical protein